MKTVCLSLFLILVPSVIPLQAQEKPVIVRSGIYNNKPKCFLNDRNRADGFFPDLLNYIASREKWDVRYVFGSWTECLQRLENGEIDVMIDVAWSGERAEKYDFNGISAFNNWGVVYKNSESEVLSINDLNGKTIAVMKDSVHYTGENGIVDLLKKYDVRDYRFIEAGDYEGVGVLIRSKKAEVGVVNRVFGSLYREQYDMKRTDIIFNLVELHFAFPKNGSLNAMLGAGIDRRLKELKRDGDSYLSKLIGAYFPEEGSASYGDDAIRNPDAPRRVELSAAEKEWIKTHPVIRFAVDPEFVPFEYLTEKGEHRGISKDYVAALNERLGLNMTFAGPLSWTRAVEMMKKKEIDVLPCIGLTAERKKYLSYSQAYTSFYRVIVTRDDLHYVFSVDDLKDDRVCVQKDSSHQGYLLEYTAIRPLAYPTFEECLRAVADNRADACVGNVVAAAYWIRKLGLPQLKMTAPLSSDLQTLHFAVRDDWPQLVGILNKGLATVGADEAQAIRNKWLDIDVDPMRDWKRLMSIALVVIAAVTAFALFFVVWNRRLAKEIELRKQAQKTIELMAITDQLTQLSNRRHFDAVFDAEIRKAGRLKTWLSFIILDIDYFKQYNDTYGHRAGDTLLAAVGKKLRDLLRRPTDFAFRLGGEEFGILFHPESPEAAAGFADSICANIEAMNMEHEKNSASSRVTASLGLFTRVPDAAATAETYYKSADEALYRAKENGRNRVVVA